MRSSRFTDSVIRSESASSKMEAYAVYPYGVGDNIYPVTEGRALVPVYDSECKILLGDREGNRYTVSVAHSEETLCGPERLALMISPFVRNDLW